MKYLTTEEKELLFREIYKEKGIYRKRNIAIFELAKYCAFRASEITNLQMSYYDRRTATLYCKRLKGSNSNTLELVNPMVYNALNDYLDERASKGISSPYLFVSQKGSPISRQRMDVLMKQYCQKAKYISPEKWHMHALRHSRAIELIELGFDVNDVQFWLGHKNIENTLKYLEYTPALKRALFSKLALFEGENITYLKLMDNNEDPQQLSEKGRQIINFYEKKTTTNRTRK